MYKRNTGNVHPEIEFVLKHHMINIARGFSAQDECVLLFPT